MGQQAVEEDRLTMATTASERRQGMERLRATVTAAIVVAGALVTGIVAGNAAAAALGNPNSALNGVYRVQYTEKELVALGTTAKYARDQAGVTTWTLKDGLYRLLIVNSNHHGECRGPFQLRGSQISADFNVKDCHGIVRAAWSLRNGWLRLRVIVATDPGDAKFFGSKPWKKIG
jgi:methyl coenzyme M reductase alpha subunit